MTLVGNTHLVAGNNGTVAALFRFLQREGIRTTKNPDIYLREYSLFGIDEARDIRTRATMRSFGERRIFIVIASAMTIEAQNALLKTTEEATGNTLFFFIVPSPHMLLATIRSRAQILEIDSKASEGIVDTRRFLIAVPAKRLEMLKPLLEKDSDDRRNIGAIITFLSSLESTMGHVRGNSGGLRSIYLARKYIGDKGALLKPLLEQVALLV